MMGVPNQGTDQREKPMFRIADRWRLWIIFGAWLQTLGVYRLRGLCKHRVMIDHHRVLWCHVGGLPH